MRKLFAIRSLLFSVLLLAMAAASFGQIGISITLAPPVLPVYEQPICPTDGYLWTPGYWGYGDDGYYWVSGDWIQPPEIGFLWTPGYWGWGGDAYAFHEGYWGQTVGFYGGISYGFGYTGNGYEGGRWDNGHFAYNTSVNRVNTTIIHNTYNTRVVENTTRVSFNGGTGGVEAHATAQQEAAGRERHISPVAAQTTHAQEARSNPELRASSTNGHPSEAAVTKSQAGVARPEAGNEREATPAKEPERENVAPTNVKPEEKAAPAAHATEIAAHKTTAPNTGNAKTDQKYQQQQNSLVAKQNQDHQRLAQQQEKEHQQLTKNNASAAQKQQVEQKHQQQTTQLEQKHTAQTQKAQTRQQPAAQSRPAESHPAAAKPQ